MGHDSQGLPDVCDDVLSLGVWSENLDRSGGFNRLEMKRMGEEWEVKLGWVPLGEGPLPSHGRAALRCFPRSRHC